MYPKALIFLSPFSALHEAPFSHAFSNSDPPPPNPILESGKLQSPPWSAMISIRTPEVIWLREKPIENFSRMCFFFPFFQARSYNSVEKVDTWCFPFFLSFLFCINNFSCKKISVYLPPSLATHTNLAIVLYRNVTAALKRPWEQLVVTLIVRGRSSLNIRFPDYCLHVVSLSLWRRANALNISF